LHPKYLDARGLVALWREALLAQAVLRGETRGYRHHPQLARFDDVGAIAQYLRGVHAESQLRGYEFAAAKISRRRCTDLLMVWRGQIDYEWEHLMRKLQVRDPARARLLRGVRRPRAHPLFRVVAGPVEAWEKV
jgi:hypothetical protein